MVGLKEEYALIQENTHLERFNLSQENTPLA